MNAPREGRPTIYCYFLFAVAIDFAAPSLADIGENSSCFYLI